MPGQYSVWCIISELHCIVTNFRGKTLLSSDYFAHRATFQVICNLCCPVEALDKIALLSVYSISHMGCTFWQILLLGEQPRLVNLFNNMLLLITQTSSPL